MLANEQHFKSKSTNMSPEMRQIDASTLVFKVDIVTCNSKDW